MHKSADYKSYLYVIAQVNLKVLRILTAYYFQYSLTWFCYKYIKLESVICRCGLTNESQYESS